MHRAGTTARCMTKYAASSQTSPRQPRTNCTPAFSPAHTEVAEPSSATAVWGRGMSTNIRVTRAGRAVRASASMAPWKETVSMSRAPRGGPATKRRPNMDWLKPLTRLS